MVGHFRGWLLLVAFLALVGAGFSFAAGKKPNNERKEDQRVRQAREHVAQAERHVDSAVAAAKQATQELHELNDKHTAAVARLQKARERCQDRSEQQLGLAAVTRTQQAAQKTFDEAAAPILAALKNTPDYQQAVAAAELARAELQRIAKQALGDDERETQLKRIRDVMLLPSQQERAAIANNPQASAAREKLTAAQAAVASVRAQVKQAVEEDSEVRSALQALMRLNDNLDRAKQTAERREAEIAQARNQVARAKQELERAQRADRNDNRPKKGKKKRK